MSSWQLVRVSLTILIIAGCQQVGPSAIKMGRLNYNEVIQETSKSQTFANIVRVRNHEPTSFIDVAQISAGVLVQASLTGGIAGIGAEAGKTGGTLAGTTGSANIGLEYQEIPTIQYQPLLGQALISQITTPIPVQSLVNLADSDWPVASLLSLSVDRITPSYEDYGLAINTLIALDDLGVVTFSARSDESSNQGTGGTDSSPKKESSPTLVVDLHPSHSYADAASNTKLQANIKLLWCRFVTAIDPGVSCEKASAVSFAVNRPRSSNAATSSSDYSLRTRSALGTLKAATETPYPSIGFISYQMYQDIVGKPWNRRPVCGSASYYTLLPEEENGGDDPQPEPIDIITEVRGDILNSVSSDTRATSCLFIASYSDNTAKSAALEAYLASLRRFILVITSDAPPLRSYVSYSDGKNWYYIAADDEISQKNFVLIGELLTIQAIAPQTLPLTPTVPVGGRG